MDEYIIKDGKKLRLGYTTGSCAAAASKAAAYMLLTGKRKDTIDLLTPKGIALHLPVAEIRMTAGEVSCAIGKDSGDDPDVTKDALIFASVKKTNVPGILIDGGDGVGRVTRRGLDQPVGATAINSVPRRMIEENVREVCRLCDYAGGLTIIISVPDGALLARKTFNPRLGIVDGISILGTTGIVEPMSEQALVDTIRVELRQRRENGASCVLLTPGNYGADFIRDSIGADPGTAVLTSNFIGDALEICRELGFSGALLIGHIGKLVKLAGGMWNTHSKFGDCRMELLAAHAAALGLSSEKTRELLDCVMCDDALRILNEEGLYAPVLSRLAGRIEAQLHHKCGEMTLEEVISVIEAAEAAGKTTVRLHTGDSSIYGAVREQFDELEKRSIAYDVCPGVSAFCGAAAALRAEYTLPNVSQSVIITRSAGKTPVPARESIRSLAAHQATMVLFLSTSLTQKLQQDLLAGGYCESTPAAVVFKATWPEEKIFRCAVGTLHETVTKNALTKTSLIVVGGCLGDAYMRSLLYDPAFATGFREASK